MNCNDPSLVLNREKCVILSSRSTIPLNQLKNYHRLLNERISRSCSIRLPNSKLSCWRQGLKSPTAIFPHILRGNETLWIQWTRLPMTLELNRRQHWQGTFHSTKLMWQIFNFTVYIKIVNINWKKKECNICRLLMFCLKSVSFAYLFVYFKS